MLKWPAISLLTKMIRGPTYLILFIVFIFLFLSVLVVDVGAMPASTRKCYRAHAKELDSGSEGSEAEHGTEDDADEGGCGLDKCADEHGEDDDAHDDGEADGPDEDGGHRPGGDDGDDGSGDDDEEDESVRDPNGSMADDLAATPVPTMPASSENIAIVGEGLEYVNSTEVPEEPTPFNSTSGSNEPPKPKEPSSSGNSTRICDTYGGGVELKTDFEVSYIKDIYTRVFTLGRMVSPKVNEKQEIRFLVLPNDSPKNSCTGGECWACLTNDMDRNDPKNPYKHPTLETCHHGLGEHAEDNKPGNDAYARGLKRKYQLMGNWNTWKFIPSGIGPDDVPLYNVMGIPPGEKTWFEEYTDLFLANIAVYEIEIPEDTRDSLLEGYRELESEIGKPVAFVNPCDGRILRDPFGHTALLPLSELPGVYFLKDPIPDNLVTNSSTPIDI